MLPTTTSMIRRIYEAALDPGAWQAVLDAVAEGAGAAGALDHARARLGSRSSIVTPELLREHADSAQRADARAYCGASPPEECSPKPRSSTACSIPTGPQEGSARRVAIETVRGQIKTVLRKTGTANRSQLVRLALTVNLPIDAS